ncbi:hypothetical protein D3C78_1425730 [compost metagenome]
MGSSTARSRGWSLTAWEARASMASRPPSPLLSARSTKVTYLSETMSVSVQNRMDSTP